ncbi:MAG: hypothetical protein GYA56_04090 [Geobacteraceae bacterium]|nr:hypothetical protein [Geobacteraceae bacterium]
MGSLLAVDLGIRTGLALYGGEGRLVWYRSQNYGSRDRLRRAINGILGDIPDLEVLVIEGGGALAVPWEREAERRGIAVLRTSAEEWRLRLLLPRQQRSGAQAKHSAGSAARRVIRWSGAPSPTSLRHDAAEAILAGLWGVMRMGWLAEPPRLGGK